MRGKRVAVERQETNIDAVARAPQAALALPLASDGSTLTTWRRARDSCAANERHAIEQSTRDSRSRIPFVSPPNNFSADQPRRHSASGGDEAQSPRQEQQCMAMSPPPRPPLRLPLEHEARIPFGRDGLFPRRSKGARRDRVGGDNVGPTHAPRRASGRHAPLKHICEAKPARSRDLVRDDPPPLPSRICGSATCTQTFPVDIQPLHGL